MNIFETVDTIPMYSPKRQSPVSANGTTRINSDGAPLDNGLSTVMPLHIEISPIFSMAGELGIAFSSLHGHWDQPARSISRL